MIADHRLVMPQSLAYVHFALEPNVWFSVDRVISVSAETPVEPFMYYRWHILYVEVQRALRWSLFSLSLIALGLILTSLAYNLNHVCNKSSVYW